MSNTFIRIKQTEFLFSPFSGQPAEIEWEPNIDDETLLFVYLGGVSLFSHISDRLVEVLGKEKDDIGFEDIIECRSIDSLVILESDFGWNGLNYYGFAPTKQQIIDPN